MRLEDFGERAQGELVEVQGGAAFLPWRLPPRLDATWELAETVERTRAAIAELSACLGQMQAPEMLLHSLRSREAVLSSRIEGTITHVRDVLLAEAAPLPSARASTDTREVLNYIVALERGRTLLADGHPLRDTLIRMLHQALLRNVRGEQHHPGEYRRTQVQIGGSRNDLSSARFVPPPPEQLPMLMDDLVAFANRPLRYGPLIECAILHYQFETIHPFEDGNGRIGRLLVPIYLQTRNVLDRPVLYISAYFEKHREQYIDYLYNVSTKRDWLPWINFFLSAMREQAADTNQRVRRILELHRQYGEQARQFSSKAAYKAIDLIMQKIFVSVGDVSTFTGTTYPTAKVGLGQLTAAGILASIGRVNGKEMWVADQLARELE